MFGDDFNTIKQELERLKKLEENYYSLNVACEEIEFENVRLEKENKKLKQVIEILINKEIQMRFLRENKNVDDYNNWIFNLMNYSNLTQEEFELLKEVFENES